MFSFDCLSFRFSLFVVCFQLAVYAFGMYDLEYGAYEFFVQSVFAAFGYHLINQAPVMAGLKDGQITQTFEVACQTGGFKTLGKGCEFAVYGLYLFPVRLQYGGSSSSGS